MGVRTTDGLWSVSHAYVI